MGRGKRGVGLDCHCYRSGAGCRHICEVTESGDDGLYRDGGYLIEPEERSSGGRSPDSQKSYRAGACCGGPWLASGRCAGGGVGNVSVSVYGPRGEALLWW